MATAPTQVTLPPGIYTIQTTTTTGNPPVDTLGKALTSPEENGKPLALENHVVDANGNSLNPNQHFIVNASGLIIASFNRNSLAYSQIPSLLHEPVKRSTTGVGWLINVEPVKGTDADKKRGWKGYILSPDEHKYYWSPDREEKNVALRRAEYKQWTFRTVVNPTL